MRIKRLDVSENKCSSNLTDSKADALLISSIRLLLFLINLIIFKSKSLLFMNHDINVQQTQQSPPDPFVPMNSTACVSKTTGAHVPLKSEMFPAA